MNTSEIMSAMIFGDGGASKVEELSTDGGSTDAGKVLVVGDNGKIAASDLTVGEGAVAVDKTFKVTGAAADSKAVGDAIDSLNGSLAHLEEGGLNIKDEVIEADITAWLEEHPEATTTVQDGAISKVKLDSDLSRKSGRLIVNYDQFVSAVRDTSGEKAFFGSEIEVNQPVRLISAYNVGEKTFVGCTFILNSNLFTWDTPSNYTNIPSFVGCTFIGNGNSLCMEGAYILDGKFTNCYFKDCSIVKNGYFVQSARFVNCRFSNAVEYPFIQSLRVYDTRFISCQAEQDNKAIIVDATTTVTNQFSLSQLSFNQCIFEGQSAPVVQCHDGDIIIDGCYTEANAEPFVKILASNMTSNGSFRITIKNTRMGPNSGVYFVYVDESFFNSSRTAFSCIDSDISLGTLINSNKFKTCEIRRVGTSSNGRLVPSMELSKISNSTGESSIAKIDSSGHIIVKKFPCLITFDSNSSGHAYSTYLYFVSLSYGNVPTVACLNDPSAKPTAIYDAETGYIDVTMHLGSSTAFTNRSAVLLNGLWNDLVRNNYVSASPPYDF